MMIPSNYSVNVAAASGKRTAPYRHWARIELPVGILRERATEMFNDICERFPEPDFRCHLDYISCSGQQLATSERFEA